MSKHEEQQAPASLGARVFRGVTSGRARAIMSVGIVLGLGAVGTLAAWTDDATATSGMFTTGTIKMKLSDSEATADAPYAITALTKTGMMPGQAVTGPIKVQNAGETQFNYTMEATAVGEAALAPFMYVSVFKADCATSIAPRVALSTTAAKPIITTGRAVTVAGSEDLCLKVDLDPSVTTAMQTKSLSVSFRFAATTV